MYGFDLRAHLQRDLREDPHAPRRHHVHRLHGIHGDKLRPTHKQSPGRQDPLQDSVPVRHHRIRSVLDNR